MNQPPVCKMCKHYLGFPPTHVCKNPAYRGDLDIVTGEYEHPSCYDCRQDSLLCGIDGSGFERNPQVASFDSM